MNPHTIVQDFCEKLFGDDVDFVTACLPVTAAILREPPGLSDRTKKELQEFSDALDKYLQTGEIDAILGPHAETVRAAQETQQNGRRRKPAVKKLSVVTEDSAISDQRPQIKAEKLSVVAAPSIKVEPIEMAAPTWIPPMKKAKDLNATEAFTSTMRCTRSKARKATRKDSDAILVETPIPTVDLSSPRNESAVPRTTRSKVRQTKNASTVDVADDVRCTRSTRGKAKASIQAATASEINNPDSTVPIVHSTVIQPSRSPTSDRRKNPKSSSPPGGHADSTLYEDARSDEEPADSLHPKLEMTYVAQNPLLESAAEVLAPLNSTFVVPSTASAVAQPQIGTASSDVATPPRSNVRKPGKEIFSPYGAVTTKKKVEAFEKLAENPSSGTKPPSTVKPKLLATPLRTKFMPSVCSTGSGPTLISNSVSGSKQNISISGSLSAQKESRERMLKKQERQQALKKKQALLLQQSETKRRLNEERQMRAQQQREAEKQKQLEIQKQKEDRMKQREQEREDKLQKLKQENEYKQLLAKKKLAEVQNLRQQNVDKPIFLVTPALPLPTADCYDSDEENIPQPSRPSWCDEYRLKLTQLSILASGEKIKNTMFCLHPQTPDLTAIFQSINPKRLKRTSSMNWKKPPRYTMMPNLNETIFTDDESSGSSE